MDDDDRALFERLRGLLDPYRERTRVKHDEATRFYLEVEREGRAEMLGAVMPTKTGVAFHYFPVYADPGLLDGLSPELRKRMRGKSCFGFSRADDPAIDELARLVRATADGFVSS